MNTIKEDYDIRRKWYYTLRDIAKAAGVSPKRVRDDKQSRKIEPSNILNVAIYVISLWLQRKGTLPTNEDTTSQSDEV